MSFKLVKISLMGLVLGSNQLGFADAPVAAPKALQIRVVRMSGKDGVMASQASKAAEDRVKEIKEQAEKDIAKQDADIQKMAKDIQAKAKVVDAEALEREHEKFNEARKKRELAAQSASEKIQRAVDKEMGKLSEQATEAAQALLKKHDLDLVVVQETGAVLAHSARIDVTQDLIKQMVSAQPTSAVKPVAATPVKK
jgi:Skp family chaperone for outer membrane proteins